MAQNVVLFGTLKYKNGQNRAFFVLISLNHFVSILGPFPWSFLLIFQAVTLYSITGRKFYCQNHKKFPEAPEKFFRQNHKKFPEAPEKFFRCSSKNFSVFHEKFWPVSRNHFACHFKVIWPVPRFAFVLKWTKSQAEKKKANRAIMSIIQKKRIFANTIIEATNSTHHILYCIMCSEDLY